MLDVLRIADLARAQDGVDPLDEATRLTLQHRPEQARTWGDDRGFGLAIGPELSLVVLPQERGNGLGRRLLEQAPPEATMAWSHGDHLAARALAASHGWERARELWVMRRPTSQPLPVYQAPDGVELRGLRPDDAHDLDELLRVNAAAFTHHPEQGSLSRAGLEERMAEPWFSADGVITAWSGSELLAFHWTKQHSATDGEVYVVGVSPAAQGRGLGRLVTLAGLDHLASCGVTEVHLYVEADNAAAVGLYSGLGFTHAATDTHVHYRRAGADLQPPV